MSANKKNESKGKIPEGETSDASFKSKIHQDENVDSGFLSGPLDQWPGDFESEQTGDQEIVLSDSGVKSCELDSGLCDTLSECLSEVKLVDTSTPPSSTQSGQFQYTVTEERSEEAAIPPAHLVIFFQPDDDGDTQLHIASIHGCEKSVATLIKICPNKELLDLTNDRGHTPLHLAVMSGNAVVTRMLVRAGLSLGVRDRAGETPLHKAAAAGRVECLQALLARVLEHPQRNLKPALNQKNYNGQTCLHLAASAGHLEALQTLVYSGADIDAKENLAGRTALHIASRRGDTRMVQFLRERADRSARDYAGRTPRRLARHTPAAALFDDNDGSDYESDSDDDMYDSDSESLFERLRESLGPAASINVA